MSSHIETVKINKKVIVQCLKAHNSYRKRHGVPDLKHNKDISTMAQKFANYLAENNKFEHSKANDRTIKGLGRCGENLAGTFGNEPGRDATVMWYKEWSSYDYKNPGFSMKSGHFTAVVWRNSTDIGVGAAMNGKGMWIVVANYYPPGNIPESFSFAENVLPLLPQYEGHGEANKKRKEKDNNSAMCSIL